jgi:ribulose-phosphate 3-epimerase
MTEPRVEIAPSILSADFARLGEQIQMVAEGGADIIHVDVMDGHFVPNLTLGPLIVKAVRHVTDLPFDCHLMIEAPERSIEAFADAGANMISVHPEATVHLHRTIMAIRNLGCKPGVVLNPSSPIAMLDDVLHEVDYVLIMSVNPGFGGQKFIPSALGKLAQARKRIDASGRPVRLEVDGGVKVDNIGEIARAGADMFVAGSAIFGSKDYAATIKAMRKEIGG